MEEDEEDANVVKIAIVFADIILQEKYHRFNF